MKAEGWYRDPYKVHTDRWFSYGEPTSLVRDGAIESDDPPPSTPFTGPLIEVETVEPENGRDLRRADDPDAGQVSDPEEAVNAGLDAAVQSFPSD